MVTIEEYRSILKDYKSPDELIRKRIDYITALCRNLTKSEIRTYVKKCRK